MTDDLMAHIKAYAERPIPDALAAECRWAVGWLGSLIKDERVLDLGVRDEYRERWVRTMTDSQSLRDQSSEPEWECHAHGANRADVSRQAQGARPPSRHGGLG